MIPTSLETIQPEPTDDQVEGRAGEPVWADAPADRTPASIPAWSNDSADGEPKRLTADGSRLGSFGVADGMQIARLTLDRVSRG